jgi:hypothetical protein
VWGCCLVTLGWVIGLCRIRRCKTLKGKVIVLISDMVSVVSGGRQLLIKCRVCESDQQCEMGVPVWPVLFSLVDFVFISPALKLYFAFCQSPSYPNWPFPIATCSVHYCAYSNVHNVIGPLVCRLDHW